MQPPPRRGFLLPVERHSVQAFLAECGVRIGQSPAYTWGVEIEQLRAAGASWAMVSRFLEANGVRMSAEALRGWRRRKEVGARA